jgi:hypothetical protein
MQKVRCQAFSLRNIALQLLVSTGFQILFHSLYQGSFHLSLTVLCAIGDMLVFSLGSWWTRIPTRRLRPRGTWDTTNCRFDFTYRAFTVYGQPSQTVRLSICSYIVVPQHRMNYFTRFRLFPFRSPLLRESRSWFLFLRVLRCFSSPRSLRNPTLLGSRLQAVTPVGLPHSDMRESTLVWQLVALFRGLLRPSSPVMSLGIRLVLWVAYRFSNFLIKKNYLFLYNPKPYGKKSFDSYSHKILGSLLLKPSLPLTLVAFRQFYPHYANELIFTQCLFIFYL